MIRAHGILALGAMRRGLAAGDHCPAIHDADPVPAALTAEAQPMFKHRPYVSPAQRSEETNASH